MPHFQCRAQDLQTPPNTHQHQPGRGVLAWEAQLGGPTLQILLSPKDMRQTQVPAWVRYKVGCRRRSRTFPCLRSGEGPALVQMRTLIPLCTLTGTGLPRPPRHCPCHEMMDSPGCPRDHFPFFHLRLLCNRHQICQLTACGFSGYFHSWLPATTAVHEAPRAHLPGISSLPCAPSNAAGTAGQCCSAPTLLLPHHIAWVCMGPLETSSCLGVLGLPPHSVPFTAMSPWVGTSAAGGSPWAVPGTPLGWVRVHGFPNSSSQEPSSCGWGWWCPGDPEDPSLQKHMKDLELNQVTDITGLSQTHSGGILGQHSNMLAGTQALQGTKISTGICQGTSHSRRWGEGLFISAPILHVFQYSNYPIVVANLCMCCSCPDPRRGAPRGNVSQPHLRQQQLRSVRRLDLSVLPQGRSWGWDFSFKGVVPVESKFLHPLLPHHMAPHTAGLQHAAPGLHRFLVASGGVAVTHLPFLCHHRWRLSCYGTCK